MAIGIGIGLPFRNSSKLEVPKNIYIAIISTNVLNIYYSSLYSVEIWISTDSENFIKLDNSTLSPYQVTGLTTDYTYYFKLRAFIGNKYSNFTNILETTTFSKSDTLEILSDSTLITSDIY